MPNLRLPINNQSFHDLMNIKARFVYNSTYLIFTVKIEKGNIFDLLQVAAGEADHVQVAHLHQRSAAATRPRTHPARPADRARQVPAARLRPHDDGVAGTQFNRESFGLSFGLKNHSRFVLRFHTLRKC